MLCSKDRQVLSQHSARLHTQAIPLSSVCRSADAHCSRPESAEGWPAACSSLPGGSATTPQPSTPGSPIAAALRAPAPRAERAAARGTGRPRRRAAGHPAGDDDARVAAACIHATPSTFTSAMCCGRQACVHQRPRTAVSVGGSLNLSCRCYASLPAAGARQGPAGSAGGTGSRRRPMAAAAWPTGGTTDAGRHAPCQVAKRGCCHRVSGDGYGTKAAAGLVQPARPSPSACGSLWGSRVC